MCPIWREGAGGERINDGELWNIDEVVYGRAWMLNVAENDGAKVSFFIIWNQI